MPTAGSAGAAEQVWKRVSASESEREMHMYGQLPWTKLLIHPWSSLTHYCDTGSSMVHRKSGRQRHLQFLLVSDFLRLIFLSGEKIYGISESLVYKIIRNLREY